MSDSRIDEFILQTVGMHWKKVAMVIALALTKRDLTFPVCDDEAEFVASRVNALIATGQLEVNGPVSQWRRSEIRIANARAL
jgi:hypothetical protein